MNVTLENGKPVRGDLIKSVVMRSDATPIPSTVEAEIRVDADMRKQLAEGKKIYVGKDGDAYRIINDPYSAGGYYQGGHDMGAVKLIGLLDCCCAVSFIRSTAIIKERATLSQIYRACGATIKAVDADFPVPRFVCPIGQPPTFPIALALQEAGGIVRWKSGRLKYFRLADLFTQKTVMSIRSESAEDVGSGFSERHEIPCFYSVDDAGQIIFGNRDKARTARFVPGKNIQQLRNMTRCLVLRKIAQVDFMPTIAAGDLIDVVGGAPLAVVTAAHVYQSGTDGSGSNQYSKLWLSSLEG